MPERPACRIPGALIVRAALDAGRRVIPIPGPSSAIAALSAAGLGAGPFVFAGFLPTGAQQRERSLRTLAADKKAFVLFEAPHRIADLMALLSSGACAGAARRAGARAVEKIRNGIGAQGLRAGRAARRRAW